MNAAYLSAFSALAGSAIGALASVLTTWLTQRYQDRTQRAAQESSRRERLFGEFIDQASRLFADALTHTLEDPSQLVPLYAIVSKLRLFASAATIQSATAVLDRVIYIFYQSDADSHLQERIETGQLDLLKDFAAACRVELRN
jgi:hypothetical protein